MLSLRTKYGWNNSKPTSQGPHHILPHIQHHLDLICSGPCGSPGQLFPKEWDELKDSGQILMLDEFSQEWVYANGDCGLLSVLACAYPERFVTPLEEATAESAVTAFALRSAVQDALRDSQFYLKYIGPERVLQAATALGLEATIFVFFNAGIRATWSTLPNRQLDAQVLIFFGAVSAPFDKLMPPNHFWPIRLHKSCAKVCDDAEGGHCVPLPYEEEVEAKVCDDAKGVQAASPSQSSGWSTPPLAQNPGLRDHVAVDQKQLRSSHSLCSMSDARANEWDEFVAKLHDQDMGVDDLQRVSQELQEEVVSSCFKYPLCVVRILKHLRRLKEANLGDNVDVDTAAALSPANGVPHGSESFAPLDRTPRSSWTAFHMNTQETILCVDEVKVRFGVDTSLLQQRV